MAALHPLLPRCILLYPEFICKMISELFHRPLVQASTLRFSSLTYQDSSPLKAWDAFNFLKNPKVSYSFQPQRSLCVFSLPRILPPHPRHLLFPSLGLSGNITTTPIWVRFPNKLSYHSCTSSHHTSHIGNFLFNIFFLSVEDTFQETKMHSFVCHCFLRTPPSAWHITGAQ